MNAENRDKGKLNENYRVVTKGRVCSPLCIMAWWREALNATASFGHVPLVVHRVIKMTLFTAKLCCDCEATITSPAPGTHMASIFQRISAVGIAMTKPSSLHQHERVQSPWIFHWVIRIYHDPRLFSSCMLKICSVRNVVGVPVAKLGNVIRMLKERDQNVKRLIIFFYSLW